MLDGSEGFAILQEGSPSPDEILRIGHGLVVRNSPLPWEKGEGQTGAVDLTGGSRQRVCVCVCRVLPHIPFQTVYADA